MYKTSEFRGEARNGIRVRSLSGMALFQTIRDQLPAVLKEEGIPARVTESEAKSGGMFGKKVPMLVISHPAPPSRYFHIGVVVNDNVISFPLLGESAENTKLNKKKYLEEQGAFIRAALVKPDEFLLQQEESWQADIIDAIDDLFD